MIADFERALANALGSRVPAPFQGNVGVAPLPAQGPAIRVGAERVEVQRPDFGERRPESVLAAGGQQRILRAVCTVALEVVAGAGQGRAQQAAGVDAALFVLDGPEFRDGSALVAAGDQGFRISSLQLKGAQVAIDPTRPAALPVALSLTAEGWFWPVGTVAQQGIAIGEIRLRGVALPLEIMLPQQAIVVGGGASTITLRVAIPGSMRLRADGVESLPFDTLAISLERPGGRPGAGSLGGGVAGNPGVILAPLADGAVTFTYTPPAAAADIDTLLVGVGDNSGGLGIIVGRFGLRSRAA